MKNTFDMPALTVVVIGRNEGERLRRCLASVRAMQPPAAGLEVIYVDSGSTDGSSEAAAKAGARIIALRAGRFTAGRARQAGWREASAPFVFFVDGDTVVNPSFAARALPLFEDPALAVVFGRTRELYPEKSLFHRAFDLQWRTFPVGSAETSMGTAMFRRSALEAVNGYDSEITGGEDGEVCGRLRRQGFLIRGVDMPMVVHDLVMTGWPHYWWRMVRNGYALAQVTDRFAPHEMTLLRSRTRHAWIWGPLLVALPVLAGVASLALQSWVPTGLAMAFCVVIVLIAAWKAHRMTGEWLNCVVFGVHMYLKAIPRAFGQVRYCYDKRKGQRTLIEYKTGSRTVFDVN